jgi:hypothetical protein
MGLCDTRALSLRLEDFEAFDVVLKNVQAM